MKFCCLKVLKHSGYSVLVTSVFTARCFAGSIHPRLSQNVKYQVSEFKFISGLLMILLYTLNKNHHFTHIISFHSIHVCPDWERLVTWGNNDRLKLNISNIKQLVVNCPASDIDIVTTKQETYQCWNINSSQRCSTQRHRRCKRSGQSQGGRPSLVSPIQCLTDCKIWSVSHYDVNVKLTFDPLGIKCHHKSFFIRVLWGHSDLHVG